MQLNRDTEDLLRYELNALKRTHWAIAQGAGVYPATVTAFLGGGGLRLKTAALLAEYVERERERKA